MAAPKINRTRVVIDPGLILQSLSGGALRPEMVDFVSVDQAGHLVFSLKGSDIPADVDECTMQFRTVSVIGGQSTLFDGLKPRG